MSKFTREIKRIADQMELNYKLIPRLKKRMAHLRNNNFTLITNNCVGGVFYNDLGLKFLSPTINLFLFAPDYIKFLMNLDYYLSQVPTYLDKSKYDNVTYPLGLLDDIELHFVHYNSFEEAAAKWEERKRRINKDNLFIIGSDRNLCTPEIIQAFDKLPFENKIFLSSQEYPELKSVVWLKEFSHLNEIPDLTHTRKWLKYIDLVAWFNHAKTTM